MLARQFHAASTGSPYAYARSLSWFIGHLSKRTCWTAADSLVPEVEQREKRKVEYEDCFYVANAVATLDREESKERLIQRLRQYLEVRNLTLLIGNGCSIPLGAPLIHDTNSVKPEFSQEQYRLENAESHQQATELLELLVPAEKRIGIEPLLMLLGNLRANGQLLEAEQHIRGRIIQRIHVDALETLLKKWLYQRCKNLSEVPDEDLRHHEELLRRVLLRSTALPRCKVFTTNYDLVLERALDNLGVMYFDGFLGTVNRTLRTESYHYDLYYPGETTEGRVSRVDRVLHLYKMHGSINWRRRAIAGLDVAIQYTTPDEAEYGDVMIYPSPLKMTEMNGYPYAEMFRHFSAHVHQQQSVLLTIGYSFQDDHINRLIYQALSIPSFVLIIVLPEVVSPGDPSRLRPEHEVWRLINQVQSKRVLVISGGQRNPEGKYVAGAGTLQDFSSIWMPDIRELTVEASVREEIRNALRPLTDRGDA